MLTSYKCPNCDAGIPFDASSGKLKCQHCSTEFDINNLEDYNIEKDVQESFCDWNITDNNVINVDGKVNFVCPACGGEVIGDENTSATNCPYCGTPIIDKKRLSGIFKPSFIIPFKLTKQDALKEYEKHIHGKLLLPNDFKVNNIIDKLNGIYIPYWLFNANANGQARYKATKTKSFSEGEYNVTETRYYLVCRDGKAEFDKVPVDASTKIDEALLDSIEPFDYGGSKEFNSAYLSSYLADKYECDSKQSVTKANQRILNSMQLLLQSSVVGYDSILPVTKSIQLKNGEALYVLLPVYLFTTKYNGKIYQFAMNGQTGKFAGNLPMDKGKAISYTLLIFVISFVILFLIFYLTGIGV